MIILPDGTTEPNIPPLEQPDEDVDQDKHSEDEYDSLHFSLGRNLGGAIGNNTYGTLRRYRVLPPLIGRRPLLYSTIRRNNRCPGIHDFQRHSGGNFAREFTWSVYYHCPPGEVVYQQGHAPTPNINHPRPPLWVPQNHHGWFTSYRCNCPLCVQRTMQYAEHDMSHHLWAFNISPLFYTIQNYSFNERRCVPRYLIREVAFWIFGHSSNIHYRTIRPNEPPVGREYLLRPTEHSYTKWFFYDRPRDPLFEGRPTIYIPWTTHTNPRLMDNIVL